MAGVRFPVEAGTLLLPTSEPPVHGYCMLFTSGKGADHSPLSSAKIKNVWNIISMRETFSFILILEERV
jgi:hypothetical protein